MSKKKRQKRKKGKAEAERAHPEEENYKETLRALQIQLVDLQRDVIAQGERVLVIVEGRDGAGKDGTIKRFVEHMSPRETRVVALGKPTDRERGSWYFQRFVQYLPAAGEISFFNRSWYNRAGVERVMGFCSPEECEAFLTDVVPFEELLVRSGVRLFKYYLSISRAEQKKRLAARRTDPLKQWKLSPIDAAALKHWDDYTEARDEMLARTHTLAAPWTVVRADDKPTARLSVMRDFLLRQEFGGKDPDLLATDPDHIARYDRDLLKDWLAR